MAKIICFNGGMPKMNILIQPFLDKLRENDKRMVKKVDFIIDYNKAIRLVLGAKEKKVFIGYSAGALNLLFWANNVIKEFDLIILIAPVGIENPPIIKHLSRFAKEIFKLHNSRWLIIKEILFDSFKSPRTSLAGLKKILKTNITEIILRQKELGAKIFFLKSKDDKLFDYSALEKIQDVKTIEMPGNHFGIIEYSKEFSSKIKEIIEKN